MSIKINKERCKGCLLCVKACPQGIIDLSGEINVKGHRIVAVKDPSKCTECGLCYVMCPECCIEIKKKKK